MVLYYTKNKIEQIFTQRVYNTYLIQILYQVHIAKQKGYRWGEIKRAFNESLGIPISDKVLYEHIRGLIEKKVIYASDYGYYLVPEFIKHVKNAGGLYYDLAFLKMIANNKTGVFPPNTKEISLSVYPQIPEIEKKIEGDLGDVQTRIQDAIEKVREKVPLDGVYLIVRIKAKPPPTMK